MQPSDLQNRFTYHAPKPEQIPFYESIRGQAMSLATYLDSIQPDSREKSLAITALEEFVMWANAGIARNT